MEAHGGPTAALTGPRSSRPSSGRTRPAGWSDTDVLRPCAGAQRRPARARRRRLPAHRGPRTAATDRRRPRRARAVQLSPRSAARRRVASAPVARDPGGNHADRAGRSPSSPPRTPAWPSTSSPARRLAARRRDARDRGSCAGACRPTATTTAREACCGPPATPPRPAAAVRSSRSRDGLLAGTLSWPAAVRKMSASARPPRLAGLPRGARATLDPRAVSIRSAALGRVEWPEPVQPVEPPPTHDPGDTDDPT